MGRTGGKVQVRAVFGRLVSIHMGTGDHFALRVSHVLVVVIICSKRVWWMPALQTVGDANLPNIA